MSSLVGSIILATACFVGADEANSPPDADFLLLFNGKDFQGWLADPDTLAHWRVVSGTIQADGKGPNLITELNYRDFELRLDWKAEKGSTGGIFLRGRPRVAIGDPDGTDPITGGLAQNVEHPSKPVPGRISPRANGTPSGLNSPATSPPFTSTTNLSSKSW